MNILRKTLLFLRPARSPLSARESRVHRSQEAYELLYRLIAYAEAENFKRARIAADDLVTCAANLRRALILEQGSVMPGLPRLPSETRSLHCSFCGKSQHEVDRLIAGAGVFVCNECVAICNDVIRDELPEVRETAPIVPAEEIQEQ